MARVTTMAPMWWPLMDGVTIKSDRCAVCGRSPVQMHHVVKRSAGKLYRNGVEVPKPLLPLCGLGNSSGCHGLAHQGMLHFRWVESDAGSEGWYLTHVHGGHWECLRTDVPVKYLDALKMDGWRPLDAR